MGVAPRTIQGGRNRVPVGVTGRITITRDRSMIDHYALWKLQTYVLVFYADRAIMSRPTLSSFLSYGLGGADLPELLATTKTNQNTSPIHIFKCAIGLNFLELLHAGQIRPYWWPPRRKIKTEYIYKCCFSFRSEGAQIRSYWWPLGGKNAN